MGIKTVPQPPYCPDLAPCDSWLFPKLRSWHYETIEDMKEAVVKVIDTLTQEDFHWTLQKLLEWYNKCIAAGGDYLEGEKSFMCVLSIKVLIRKKSRNLSYAPHIVHTYTHTHTEWGACNDFYSPETKKKLLVYICKMFKNLWRGISPEIFTKIFKDKHPLLFLYLQWPF